ncbi:P-type conjugative transfer protein TrbG [Hyphomicrobium sp. CS1BSMeth3]|uniref:P-type conjugative transfer protein TrbG n=1 Tax=Hyphomicrobium sp. CS1BSMeth3 TaxID=1892844 RepID=UPI000931B4C5|nr:P-type conjugative transfer protein TrbG [Hyphomicrobium sp. CS1BSMeth3]
MRQNTLGVGACVVLVGLTGCAKTVPVPEIPLLKESFTSATRTLDPEPPVKIVTVAEPLPLPGQLKPAPKPGPAAKDDTPPKERIAKANAAARIEPAKDGYVNAIQVYPFAKGALYQVYAAVNQVTDIALESGEKLISVSAGDTARWVVGDTTSGEGTQAQVHVLVKPFAGELQTNLVIATDRRAYHLELRSTDGTYMASVSWTYPASELIALRTKDAEARTAAAAIVEDGVNLEKLRFRYRLEGDAPWKPTQVFDDGAKVYIRFPAGLAQSEAPPLFVVGSDGKPALVNYRVRGATYIVDRLFAAAELRMGTSPQRIVRIVRTDAVWREARP